MKKMRMLYLTSVLILLSFACSCSSKEPEESVHKPNYSFLNEAYGEKSDNSVSTTNSENKTADTSNVTKDSSDKSTDTSSNNSSDTTSDKPLDSSSNQTLSPNKIEWPYELNFEGVDSKEEVKIGNLRTNYKIGNSTSCMICPDIENDILYYVNTKKNNYIYQLKDGTISLLVEKEAYYLQLWDNKLYFLSPNNNINDLYAKSGDIYCFDLKSKELELILKTNAILLIVDSYGIYYRYVDETSSLIYHLDFSSTTPQKTEYLFYFTYNEYMIVNELDKIYICNRETGDKSFLLPLIYMNYNDLIFGDDYMVFTENELIYVLNLRTGKKDIYDLKSMIGMRYAAIDYFIKDSILYMVNTNTFLALDLSNGELKFPSKYITYDEEIVSKYVFAGKDHYCTIYNFSISSYSNYLISERELSTGKLIMELYE